MWPCCLHPSCVGGETPTVLTCSDVSLSAERCAFQRRSSPSKRHSCSTRRTPWSHPQGLPAFLPKVPGKLKVSEVMMSLNAGAEAHVQTCLSCSHAALVESTRLKFLGTRSGNPKMNLYIYIVTQYKYIYMPPSS